MTPEEWKTRFMARVVEQLGDGFTAEAALEAAENEYDAVSDTTMNPAYMDERPEDSADECLSYWDDDTDRGDVV